jgi:hypothetical protein
MAAVAHQPLALAALLPPPRSRVLALELAHTRLFGLERLLLARTQLLLVLLPLALRVFRARALVFRGLARTRVRVFLLALELCEPRLLLLLLRLLRVALLGGKERQSHAVDGWIGLDGGWRTECGGVYVVCDVCA